LASATTGAGVEEFGEALDRTALAGRVAALEKHDDFRAGFLDPSLHLDQFDLEIFRLLLVGLVLDALFVGVGGTDDLPFARHGQDLVDDLLGHRFADALIDELDHRE